MSHNDYILNLLNIEDHNIFILNNIQKIMTLYQKNLNDSGGK